MGLAGGGGTPPGGGGTPPGGGGAPPAGVGAASSGGAGVVGSSALPLSPSSSGLASEKQVRM